MRTQVTVPAERPVRYATDELARTPDSDQPVPVEAARRQQGERYRPTSDHDEHHSRALHGKPRHPSLRRGGVRDEEIANGDGAMLSGSLTATADSNAPTSAPTRAERTRRSRTRRRQAASPSLRIRWVSSRWRQMASQLNRAVTIAARGWPPPCPGRSLPRRFAARHRVPDSPAERMTMIIGYKSGTTEAEETRKPVGSVDNVRPGQRPDMSRSLVPAD